MRDFKKPVKMPKLARKHLLSRLEVILTAAEMTHARFPQGFDSSLDITEIIKERTRLYRQSWIIAPLKRLLEDFKEPQ